MQKPAKPVLFSVTIHDCDVETFRCSGNGGQNVNKVESGVRIIHRASKAMGRACDTRDQLRNKRLAFERMAKTVKFQNWIRIEANRRLGFPSVEQLVEKAMHPSNLLVEVRNSEGRWQVI